MEAPCSHRRIAFTAVSGSGTTDVYLMNADGSGRVALTNDRDGTMDPAWSRDGSRIVFARWYGLLTVNADGTDLVEVGFAGARWPSWSPDGTTLAFWWDRSCAGWDYDDFCPGPQALWLMRMSDGDDEALAPRGTRAQLAAVRQG